MPIQTWSRTHRQPALGYVIAAGLKVFTLAVVVSFAFAIFPTIPIPDELSFTTQFTIMGVSLVFVLLALKAPGLAASMISGGPSLGVGALGQTAAAVVGGGAVGYAGFRAAGAVGSAAAQAKQGLQDRFGGGGAGRVPTGSSGGAVGGGSSGGKGTAVAVRPSSAVRSPGTSVGPYLGGGSSTGSGGGQGGPSPGLDGGPSSTGGGGGREALPEGGSGATTTELEAVRRSLGRAGIATGAALGGGDGGSSGAKVDLSSRSSRES